LLKQILVKKAFDKKVVRKSPPGRTGKQKDLPEQKKRGRWDKSKKHGH
jgi:hypothetical protein